MSLALGTGAGELSPASLLAVPKIVPPFVRTIGRLAPEIGVGGAVQEVLNNANIHLEVEGDLPGAGNGLLVASDHRHRMEPFLMQAVTHQVGRSEGSHVVAMPTSFAGRLIQASGSEGEKLIIPVVPTVRCVENRPSLCDIRAAYRYWRYPNVFANTKEAVKRLNAQAVVRAAGKVGAGSSVTIYPTGTLAEAGGAPWRAGIGRIVQEMSPEALQEAQVAVLRPDDFPIAKITAALALRDMGIRPRQQTITVRAEVLGSPDDLFGTLTTSEDPQAAQEIADITKEHYCASFSMSR